MLENTPGVVSQLITFLNDKLDYKLNINKTDLDKIIQNTSFDNLKSKEIRNGFAEATNNSLFFRSGKKNQWAKELSINQQKKIKEVFNEAMNYFDYI